LLINLNRAGPIQTLYIVQIERYGFLISLQRPLGVGEARDGAEVAVGSRRVLAVPFGLRGRLFRTRRLVLREGAQELRRLGDLVFLQETEGLLQARIAFACALRDRPDRRADGLLRAWPGRRISLQQHFGQRGNLGVLLAQLVGQRLLDLLDLLFARPKVTGALMCVSPPEAIPCPDKVTAVPPFFSCASLCST
jgi:hypothetical protein